MALPTGKCPHCRQCDWSEIPNKPVPCVKCNNCGSEYMAEFIAGFWNGPNRRGRF